MAMHCHEASYVPVLLFPNMLVPFSFMSDIMIAVDPFLDRIPKQLHEQYMTDLLTKLMKLNMADTNNSTGDGGIPYKYRLVVALARKI
jgi:hypothetical protein